jgi:hypothetical protein
MGGIQRLRAVAVSAIATAMLVVGVAPAHGAPAGVGPHPARRIVTLITGERVALGTSPTGTPTAEVLRAAPDGPAAQVKIVSMGGHVYAIPASAMAYFGRFLDPSGFDVSALAAAGFGERIPLKITYSGTLPALPGVHITSKGSGRARGYVTRASAKTFGAAIADQAIADSQAGWPATDALFGSITSIAPAMKVAPVVTPQFPQATLVMRGYTKTGAKMPFGFGTLFNMDDGAKFAGFFFMYRGQARASVPLGTYAAIVDDMKFSTDGSFIVREDVVTDFAVTGTQPAMRIDSALATAEPSLTTPKPAVPQELDFDVSLRDERGRSSFTSGWSLGLPGQSARVTPVATPTVGTVGFDTRWIAVDPSTAGGTYSFDANAVYANIPADLSQVLGPVDQAMAVDNTYYSDGGFAIGGTARFIFLPHTFFAFASFMPQAFPFHRVDYVYAPPKTSIADTAVANFFAWDPGFVDGPYLPFAPGTTDTERWFRNPYTLDVPVVDPSSRFVPCIVCVSDTRMSIGFNVHDGDPRHYVEVFAGPTRAPVAVFKVYRNDSLLVKKDNWLGSTFKIPSGPAKYRVSQTLTRRFTGSSLSTDLRTDVVFNSRWAQPAPKGWYCYPGKPCSILPVPTASIDLHTTTRGTIPVGPASFDLQVGHVTGITGIDIASVAVAIRRTGTPDWLPATMTDLGGGAFRAGVTLKDWMANRDFDVRVTVVDAHNDKLVQTTTRAFLVAP